MLQRPMENNQRKRRENERLAKETITEALMDYNAVRTSPNINTQIESLSRVIAQLERILEEYNVTLII